MHETKQVQFMNIIIIITALKLIKVEILKSMCMLKKRTNPKRISLLWEGFFGLEE